MSEERKFKASHFENIQELIASCMIWIKTDDYDAYCRFFDMGAMEELIKELNNLKEIEKSHKEENGKLRVELEKYKLLNANIEKANEIIKSNKLNEKEREIIETYRKLIEETGRNDWIICNPKTMWSNYFVRKDKIKEEIRELEQQIAEFKEYVKDSKGQEKTYWRRELAELVGARNSLRGLLEDK